MKIELSMTVKPEKKCRTEIGNRHDKETARRAYFPRLISLDSRIARLDARESVIQLLDRRLNWLHHAITIAEAWRRLYRSNSKENFEPGLKSSLSAP